MLKINRNYRQLYCASVCNAFVASGRLSATNVLMDSLWDYIPGQYIVERAGGVVYNAPGIHIVANTNEFLQVRIENSAIDNEKQLTLVKES